jgi:CDP-diacylglycerol--inositol 3-phosphatidyltransferase
MAPKKDTKKEKKNLTSRDVLLFYPNLIGYMRFAFMLASFAFAHTNWKLSIACYGAAFTGDVLDGYVARAFNQCTNKPSIVGVGVDDLANSPNVACHRL